jgi:hypothetical protein
MVRCVVCVTAFVAIALGCGRHPDTQIIEPARAPAPAGPDITTLALPEIDPTTLASLNALLEELKTQSARHPLVTLQDDRVYTLFRDLETAQRRMNDLLSTSDAEGRTLYDRLVMLTQQADSLLRVLEPANRPPLRP